MTQTSAISQIPLIVVGYVMGTLQNGTEILSNWILRFEVQSNNMYHVELFDKFGKRRATANNKDLEAAIKTCEKSSVFQAASRYLS